MPSICSSERPFYDVFCGAGGATKGYKDAGFSYVIGIDNRPQPRYVGDKFIQMDALEFLQRYLDGEYPEACGFHSSPPCQGYSSMRHVTGKSYPDLIAPTRRALQATGKPFVIENVVGAPLNQPIMLCGTMFGLDVVRHRLFETHPQLWSLRPPCCHNKKCAKQGRPATPGKQFMTVTGNYSGQEFAKRAMGIDWMVRSEMSQAIPPAYTEFIGRHLLEAMGVQP